MADQGKQAKEMAASSARLSGSTINAEQTDAKSPKHQLCDISAQSIHGADESQSIASLPDEDSFHRIPEIDEISTNATLHNRTSSTSTLDIKTIGSDASIDSATTQATSVEPGDKTELPTQTDIRAFPLFLMEHKLAYNHDFEFSQNGGCFSYSLYDLPEDLIAIAYDWVISIYPDNAIPLRQMLRSAMGAEGLQLLQRNKPSYAKIASGRISKAKTATVNLAKLGRTVESKASSDKNGKTMKGRPLPEKDTLVDNEEDLQKFVALLADVPKYEPELFCDCEGHSLSRYGTLSTFQVKFASLDHTWILDVTVLRAKIFNTVGPGSNGRSFRQILQDPEIPVIFFDVRNDSDALYAHYQIRLTAVIDLQLMDAAVRSASRRLSLDNLMSQTAGIMDWFERATWRYNKTNGKSYCEGELGYGVFDIRPLAPELRRYAVNDVELMPALFTSISKNPRMDDAMMKLILTESKRMAEGSFEKGYQPNGYGKATAPRAFWGL